MTKNHPQKQVAGVWLDLQRAVVVASDPSDESGYSLQEAVTAHREERRGNEHTINNGKRSDTLKYFKEVADRLTEFDGILIFGPGNAQEEFQNFLKENPHFRNCKISIDTAQQMTGPEMIAQVREHFEPQPS